MAWLYELWLVNALFALLVAIDFHRLDADLTLSVRVAPRVLRREDLVSAFAKCVTQRVFSPADLRVNFKRSCLLVRLKHAAILISQLNVVIHKRLNMLL